MIDGDLSTLVSIHPSAHTQSSDFLTPSIVSCHVRRIFSDFVGRWSFAGEQTSKGKKLTRVCFRAWRVSTSLSWSMLIRSWRIRYRPKRVSHHCLVVVPQQRRQLNYNLIMSCLRWYRNSGDLNFLRSFTVITKTAVEPWNAANEIFTCFNSRLPPVLNLSLSVSPFTYLMTAFTTMANCSSVRFVLQFSTCF